MNEIAEIKNYLNEIGAKRYGDSDVSQLQHALQCASLAENSGASPELIAAALLHDIGHIVDDHYPGAAEAGIDRRHEQIGSGYLANWFGPAVSEPVKLHVSAKRYLCGVEEGYFATLSEGSVLSLELQGGPYDGPAAEQFVSQDYAQDAIDLRRWDDLAKDPDAITETVEHYMSFVSTALERSKAA